MSKEVADAINHLASVLDRLGEGTNQRPGVIEHISMSIKEGCQVIADALTPTDYTDAIQAVADALESVADAIKDKK